MRMKRHDGVSKVIVYMRKRLTKCSCVVVRRVSCDFEVPSRFLVDSSSNRCRWDPDLGNTRIGL